MDNEPINTGEPAPPAPPEAPIPPVESEPAPPPQDAPAPAKSGGGKGPIIAIAVIAVVAIVVLAFMFMGGSIEGKWELESGKIYDADGTLNQEATDAFDGKGEWMEFKSDGSIANSDGEDDGTWKTDGDKLTITSTYEYENYDIDANGNITWDNQTMTDTIEFTYKVSFNTLTLEMEYPDGSSMKLTAKKA